jgi:CheY-like chemotaxis protein
LHPPLPPSLERARILVVDDEPDVGVALKDLLETSYAATVTCCVSGREALGLLASEPFDLMVTDYKMPGMNGVQLIDAARIVAPGLRHILITAFDRELVTNLARRGLHEEILRKPIEPDVILDHVARSLAADKTAVAP